MTAGGERTPVDSRAKVAEPVDSSGSSGWRRSRSRSSRSRSRQQGATHVEHASSTRTEKETVVEISLKNMAGS